MGYDFLFIFSLYFWLLYLPVGELPSDLAFHLCLFYYKQDNTKINLSPDFKVSCQDQQLSLERVKLAI